MALSFAEIVYRKGINYQQNLLIIAQDISDICVYMTYIQLALYGIPAVVYCGNTITMEMRFKMETPLYFLQSWKFNKFFYKNENKPNIEESQEDETSNISTEYKNLLKEVTVKGNCQISLF